MTGYMSVIAAGASLIGVLVLVGCTAKPGPAPASAPPTIGPVNGQDVAYCNQLAFSL